MAGDVRPLHQVPTASPITPPPGIAPAGLFRFSVEGAGGRGASNWAMPDEMFAVLSSWEGLGGGRQERLIN